MTSLDKGLLLIDTLARLGRAGIKVLSGATGFPPSTVHRLLATLGQGGYVRQDPQTKEYHLSIKLLELAAKVRGELDLVALARPFMKELAESSGEAVNLVVFDNFEAVYVEQESNTRAMLRMFTRVGARVPLYCSGVGKAYLAAQDEPTVRAYFEHVEKKPRTSQTIVDLDILLKELAVIREHGYAMDNEEMETGVRCVAVSVFGFKDQVAGAMSISGPSARMTLERIPALSPMLCQAAKAISSKLGLHATT